MMQIRSVRKFINVSFYSPSIPELLLFEFILHGEKKHRKYIVVYVFAVSVTDSSGVHTTAS
jgi:hypothetical protein